MAEANFTTFVRRPSRILRFFQTMAIEWRTRVARFALLLLGLCVVVFRSHKRVWAMDMAEKDAGETE